MPKPTGPQFLRVYHSSWSGIPPHRVNAKHGPDHDFGMANTHPEIIHAGTERAASDIEGMFASRRPYIHMYDIPAHMQHSVVYGDDFDNTFFPEEEDDPRSTINEYRTKEFKEKMSGIQEGLFETITGTPDVPLKSNQAVPYRNKVEDIGSISWMIPKSAINPRGIRYAGFKKQK